MPSAPTSGRTYRRQLRCGAEPAARQDITGEREIAMRMAEDAAGLIRERGADAVITIDDLRGRGWSLAQVLCAGSAAIDLVRAELAARSDVA